MNPANLHQLLLNTYSQHKNRPAVLGNKTAILYNDLHTQMGNIATKLRSLGISPGQRILVKDSRDIGTIASLFAIWELGAIAVPIDRRIRATSLKEIITQIKPALLIDKSSFSKEYLTESDSIPFSQDQLIFKSASINTEHPILSPEHSPAAIVFTSGTVANPKGVVHTHSSLIAGARIFSSYLSLQQSDIWLFTLPISFSYGLNQVLATIYKGASLCFPQSNLIGDTISAIRDFDVTGISSVPIFFRELIKITDSSVPLPTLRFATCAGGHLNDESAKSFNNKFKTTSLFLMYGTTETIRATFLRTDLSTKLPSSVGTEIPETKVLILNPEGGECAPNISGEVHQIGPTLAEGYWNNPSETKQKFIFSEKYQKKMFATGDLGFKDEMGNLVLIGRKDDQVKISGYRFNLKEVEELILQSNIVSACCVIANETQQGEPNLIAHCELKDRAKSDSIRDQLVRFTKDYLPTYMQPKRIIIYDHLPLSLNGKIDRHELKRLSIKSK